jgi:hypothetical protein
VGAAKLYACIMTGQLRPLRHETWIGSLFMFSIISGIIVAGGGGAGLWYFKPRDGQVHPLALKPFLDSLIPISIVTALAIGVALIVAGAVS